MQPIKIQTETGREIITVHASYGIYLSQHLSGRGYADGTAWMRDVQPDQARELADALWVAADEFEGRRNRQPSAGPGGQANA